jgi:hypothetical protein
MMTEEMMKQMHAMMSSGSHVMGAPMAKGAALAAGGFAAGRGLLGGLFLRNPLVLLAGGVAAGFLLHKYRNEIVQALGQAGNMGKDFALHQQENLADLMAEAQEGKAAAATPATPAASAETAAA